MTKPQMQFRFPTSSQMEAVKSAYEDFLRIADSGGSFETLESKFESFMGTVSKEAGNDEEVRATLALVAAISAVSRAERDLLKSGATPEQIKTLHQLITNHRSPEERINVRGSLQS